MSRGSTPPLQIRPGDVHIHHACDVLSGLILIGMVLFCPWALGSTQPWSTWTMNAAGYTLGILLLIKLWVCHARGYVGPRWGTPRLFRPGVNYSGAVGGLLAANVSLLLYTLVSALNAAATYHSTQLRFDYHPYIRWLPHSLDSARTWKCFWDYLALTCGFWAIRDWLLGKGESEARPRSPGRGIVFPCRLAFLLWLVCINGALLALEGLIQRFEGSGRLLFLVQPRVNPGAETQFGPWAYRGNAAAWFNLLWPLCLGFWWTLHHHGPPRQRSHHWLLVCATIMAVCPIVSTSRGGALVAFGLLGASGLFLGASAVLRRGWRAIVGGILVLAFCLASLSLGLWLGWKSLAPRMAELNAGVELREQMYATARPMAEDYPLYGTGPGTFETVFQLYRISSDTYWPAQLHNDWLETRITFGWIGTGLIVLALLAVLVTWFTQGALYGGRRFVGLIWLAMAGALVHARYDFHFQIYSVVFLFLMLCAILSVLTRHQGAASPHG
jgi:hypothetical protein